MAELRVNPTRMELKKLQARYLTARRGHKLLKDKRDELMRQFLDVVRENKTLRERVETRLAGVYRGLSVANAVMSPEALAAALLCPTRDVRLDVTYRNVMGVTVPEFHPETVAGDPDVRGADVLPYGFAFTSGELDASLQALNESVFDLLRLAQVEKTAQLLAEEIERTRRRVNALEYIMIPRYLDAMRAIRMKLEENERGNTARLMKMKDRVISDRLRQERERSDAASPE